MSVHLYFQNLRWVRM